MLKRFFLVCSNTSKSQIEGKPHPSLIVMCFNPLKDSKQKWTCGIKTLPTSFFLYFQIIQNMKIRTKFDCLTSIFQTKNILVFVYNKIKVTTSILLTHVCKIHTISILLTHVCKIHTIFYFTSSCL